MTAAVSAELALTGSGNVGRRTGVLDKIARSGVSSLCQNIYRLHPVLTSFLLECTLPSLSSLLENTRISETDTFVICIQIHSPVGPQFPQHPSAYYVPRDLLDGVEASLDNPRKHIIECHS